MSSFIVENKTINKIVNFLGSSVSNNSSLGKKFIELGYNLNTEEGKERLANAMYILNVSGVTARYGTADDMIGDIFKYSILDTDGGVACFKALHCWLYQCDEGDIPEKSDLYKLFNDGVRVFMAEYIVTRLPGYEGAYWG